MNYHVEWDFRESFTAKAAALRRAAAITKFYRGVVKVYYKDQFIKSFDGRRKMSCNCAYCTQPSHWLDRNGEPSPCSCHGWGKCPSNNTCRYCDYWRYHVPKLQED